MFAYSRNQEYSKDTRLRVEFAELLVEFRELASGILPPEVIDWRVESLSYAMERGETDINVIASKVEYPFRVEDLRFIREEISSILNLLKASLGSCGFSIERRDKYTGTVLSETFQVPEKLKREVIKGLNSFDKSLGRIESLLESGSKISTRNAFNVVRTFADWMDLVSFRDLSQSFDPEDDLLEPPSNDEELREVVQEYFEDIPDRLEIERRLLPFIVERNIHPDHPHPVRHYPVRMAYFTSEDFDLHKLNLWNTLGVDPVEAIRIKEKSSADNTLMDAGLFINHDLDHHSEVSCSSHDIAKAWKGIDPRQQLFVALKEQLNTHKIYLRLLDGGLDNRTKTNRVALFFALYHEDGLGGVSTIRNRGLWATFFPPKIWQAHIIPIKDSAGKLYWSTPQRVAEMMARREREKMSGNVRFKFLEVDELKAAFPNRMFPWNELALRVSDVAPDVSTSGMIHQIEYSVFKKPDKLSGSLELNELYMGAYMDWIRDNENSLTRQKVRKIVGRDYRRMMREVVIQALKMSL